MKRLLTLLLTLALALGVVAPVLTLAAEPQEGTTPPAYSDLAYEDYNALYVADGLVFMLDFYKTNEYWNTNGTDYTVPIGPSDNTAYQYEGTTYDLSKDTVRSCWRVVIKRTYEQSGAQKTSYTFYEPTVAQLWKGQGTPKTEYATEVLAKDAATAATLAVRAAIDAYNAGLDDNTAKLDKMEYTCEAYYCGNNAFIQAHKEWVSADKAYLAQFVTPVYLSSVDADGNPTSVLSPITISSYTPAVANAGNTSYLTTHSHTVFSPFVMKDGYVQMRESYNSSGGIVMGGVVNDSVYSQNMSMQIVTSIAGHKDNQKKPTLLYAGTRLILNQENGQIYATGFTNTTFAPTVTPFPAQTASLYIDDLMDLTYTVTSTAPATTAVPSTFTLRTHTGTVLSVDGNYKKESTTYYGWSTSAPNSKLYAIRNYNAELTAADLLQNHLADLCKFFRLDISALYEKSGDTYTLAVSESVIGALAAMMASYTMQDDRADVAAAMAAAIATVTLEGEGASALADAIAAGLVNGMGVYALAAEHRADVFAAYAAFAAENPSADAAAHQAAVDAAVDAALTKYYADWHKKPVALTAEAFFAASPTETNAAAHFAKIAVAFGLDMTDVAALDPVVREYLYEEFATIFVGAPYHTATLQKKVAETAASLADYFLGEGLVDDLLGFLGYQFRLVGATAFRAAFEVDADVIALLEDSGYTVTVGILYRSGKDGMMTVEKVGAGEYVPTEPSAVTDPAAATQKLVYTTADGFLSDSYYEIFTESSLTKHYFYGYVTLEREGNEDLVYYCNTTTENFKRAVTLKDVAEVCREYGYVSTNVQKFHSSRNVTPPTVFLGGRNISEFLVVLDSASAAVSEGYLAALKEVTGADLRTITADEAADRTEGLVLFVKGDYASVSLEDGNIVFTYTDDYEAELALFSAELAKPEEGYPTYAFEEEAPLPVCLLPTWFPLY